MRYLIFLMLPLLLMKCAKQDQCLETYDFQVFSDISPKSSALSLGDTLSFSMITDNTAIFDSFGYRSVNYPNFDHVFLDTFLIFV